MASTARVEHGRMTAAEFAELPEEEGYRLELSRGVVVREPAPGPRHSRVTFRVVELLRRFGEERGLGLLFFDAAFSLSEDPPTVRVPDAAFVHADRIPGEGITDRVWELAPDLAVEVVSPSNRATEMQRKALDYLDAGARLVWVVDPGAETVTVYASRSEIRILTAGDELDGAEVLPDLEATVESLFTTP